MSFRDDFKEAANLAKDFFQEDRKQREKEQNTIMLKCPYCGGENRVVWQEGALPRCPNCGGEYNAADIEAWKEEQRKKIAALNVPHETPSESVGSFLKRGKKYLVIAAGAIVLLIGCGIAAALNGGHFDARFEINGSTAPAASSGEEPADTSSDDFSDDFSDDNFQNLYIPELERECAWSEEDGWWYDEQTECYFRYNPDGYPADWTYWTPSISGNYGDYGWLYYDPDLDKWYVQTDEDEWKSVPDEYNTSDLWYISEDYPELLEIAE